MGLHREQSSSQWFLNTETILSSKCFTSSFMTQFLHYIYLGHSSVSQYFKFPFKRQTAHFSQLLIFYISNIAFHKRINKLNYHSNSPISSLLVNCLHRPCSAIHSTEMKLTYPKFSTIRKLYSSLPIRCKHCTVGFNTFQLKLTNALHPLILSSSAGHKVADQRKPPNQLFSSFNFQVPWFIEAQK